MKYWYTPIKYFYLSSMLPESKKMFLFHRIWHTNAQCHVLVEKITEINIPKLVNTPIRLLTFNFSQDFDAQIHLHAAELNADSMWLEYTVRPGKTQFEALNSHHQGRGPGTKRSSPGQELWGLGTPLGLAGCGSGLLQKKRRTEWGPQKLPRRGPPGAHWRAWSSSLRLH